MAESKRHEKKESRKAHQASVKESKKKSPPMTLVLAALLMAPVGGCIGGIATCTTAVEHYGYSSLDELFPVFVVGSLIGALITGLWAVIYGNKMDK